jgi:alpha-glucosidase (family GH31 glycosyl hydrolase)
MSIPVFARAGSFVPLLRNALSNTRQYSTEQLEIRYYPLGHAGEAEFDLYQDDGHTPQAFRRAMYQLLVLKATETDTDLELSFDKQIVGDFEGATYEHQLEIRIFGQKQPPQTVEVEAKALPYFATSAQMGQADYGWYYDAPQQAVVVRFVYLGVSTYHLKLSEKQ